MKEFLKREIGREIESNTQRNGENETDERDDGGATVPIDLLVKAD